MDPSQRRVVAIAAYATAIVLFVFFFGRGFWEWAAWDAHNNTLDLGFVKFSSRPAFPSDVKSIVVGLILPIVLVALGRVVDRAERT